ncbi:COP9 signalosome subunit 1 [Aspergillus niger]|nr:COP9 signalosome subunit 1 [Aspergillus niger]
MPGDRVRAVPIIDYRAGKRLGDYSNSQFRDPVSVVSAFDKDTKIPNSLMVSNRPGSRIGLTETRGALDRLANRRIRNRRRNIRRRERARAQMTNVARRGNHALNISRRGPVHAAATSQSLLFPQLHTPGEQVALPVLHPLRVPVHEPERVSSVATATSDTDVTMGFEEPNIGGMAVDASQPQPVDDLISFDTLDTAEDEVVVISSHTSDIVESHCGELFTIV